MASSSEANDSRVLELAWNGCAPDASSCQWIRAAWRRQEAAGLINGCRLTAEGERYLLAHKPYLKLMRPFHAD